MLSGRPEHAAGSAITCVMEGTRPLLLEVQALLAHSNYGYGRRTASGTDYNRVNLLLAVLEKHLNMPLSDCDAFVNVTGGMRLNDPSLDLAMILALYSSYRNIPLDAETMVFGEVGLAGEVRNVNMLEQRVKEAEKLGFNTCIVPKAGLKTLKNIKGIRIIGVENVKEAINTMKNALNESPNIV